MLRSELGGRRAGNLDDARLRWKEARQDYLAASDLAEKEGDRRRMGLSWRDIAVILHQREKQPGQALKAYERALEPLRAAGTPEVVDGTLLTATFPDAQGVDRMESIPWQDTFGRVPFGALLLYEDSLGRLCIAENQGSAGRRLGLTDDRLVSLRRA